MRRNLITVGAFVGVCAASAFLAWCSGFNFNERGAGVALWIAQTWIIGIGVSAMVRMMLTCR